ncbi:arabinosyltransferase domain-containing protein [Nocardia sp. XZ_19_385]|uniref:arabinosyltransferase domain-containing protein n=1 Tax=Nocardia sp. XZ_19_385 TaxID=2769488 RepID=UPI0028155A4B|nr:arabinosyltransferase domain-containing protein [Nocardia sp. XZ_19_385]
MAPVEKPAATGLCGVLTVHSTASGTTAELSGLTRADGTPFRKTIAEDIRPQIVGLYTDLDRAQLGDARLHVEIDSRFSSSPSLWKLAAIIGAVLCTLVALICLHLLDTTDGRRMRRFLPARWWRFNRTDGVVGGTLLLWHVVGANTSDDGYILTMAKASREAGYTANYYRWFGVAEAPFGWPYEVLAWMTRITDASLWMRLPALLTGLLCWWLISREVLPRLGSRVRTNTMARWTAGLMFLAIWLPYNNGLRPEPLIALGALLTWCSMERAIATRRLLPAAAAVLIATFALAAGPSGLICLAALFAGSWQVSKGVLAGRRYYATTSVESAMASGDSAVLSGESAMASGDSAVLSGESAMASGDSAVLSGEPVTASGDSAVSSGEPVTASGDSAGSSDEPTTAPDESAITSGESAAIRFGAGQTSAEGEGKSASRPTLSDKLRAAPKLSLRVGRPGPRQVAAMAAGPISRLSLGDLALVAPILAAGSLVLVVVFADQTFGSVLEAVRVRRLVGPDLAWFEETTRWESLFSLTPDGSLARRFGILVMLLCLGLCSLVAMRRGGRIPDTARGPVTRVLAVVIMSLLLMVFTPTKWTHHLGVYAGLAAALAAVAAVVLGSNMIRARYQRSLVAAAVLFLLAFCCTGSNGWWYVSGYGVAWPNRSPQLAGIGVTTLLLIPAVVFVLASVWHYFRESHRNDSAPSRFAVQPLALAAAALVLFEVVTMAAAACAQYPAYSVALSNVRSLAGNRCGMADSVLVETNTADSFLQPFTGSAAEGLDAENTGFTANGVGELVPDGPPSGNQKKAGPPPGSTALPFGLDPTRIPILGSYTSGATQAARLTTEWYRLDLTAVQQDPAYRVLILTVAGRIEGSQLRMEFADRAGDGTIRPLGELVPPQVGGAPMWRNLPLALDRIPEGTNAIRLVAAVDQPSGQQWLAVTPPRLPHLATLNSLVGSTAPVLTDFHVGFAFPCQRPFGHRDGVAELPVWRITPDKLNSRVAETWQNDTGGGPLGWTGLLTRSRTLPAYLEHDWTRDWGELQLLTSLLDAPSATLTSRTETDWGLEDYGPIGTR